MKNLIKLAFVICLTSISYRIHAGSCSPTPSFYGGECSISGNDYAAETYYITSANVNPLSIQIYSTIRSTGYPYGSNSVFLTASWSTTATTPPTFSSTPGWWSIWITNNDPSSTLQSGGDEASVSITDIYRTAGPITLTAEGIDYTWWAPDVLTGRIAAGW
jgi:hypothetical protein